MLCIRQGKERARGLKGVLQGMEKKGNKGDQGGERERPLKKISRGFFQSIASKTLIVKVINSIQIRYQHRQFLQAANEVDRKRICYLHK